MTRTVVLAGSLAQFRLWCRQNGVDPRAPNVVYAASSQGFAGLAEARVIRCGTWHLRPDARELDRAARTFEERAAGPAP
jgi:hypothetical protein